MASPDVIAMLPALTSGLDGSSGWPSGPSSGAGATEDDENTAVGSGTASGHAAPDELTPGTAVGRYMILSRLGAGAMGVVYAAYDPELDRKVAIKLLRHVGVDPRSRAVLLAEAQALARLAHPNVIHVYEVGETRERVFIAMEFVRGQTLRQWLRQPRPWPEVVAMFLQAGRGLAAAHQAGVLHCDFKPKPSRLPPKAPPSAKRRGSPTIGAFEGEAVCPGVVRSGQDGPKLAQS